MAAVARRVGQCQKPSGWMGRFTLWSMNARHSKVTDWGLQQVTVAPHCNILDVGCGGGRTVSKLAAMAPQGKVYGVDFSEESVAASKRFNARGIEMGRVEIHLGSVSQLPFPEGKFDLVTGVETHFWWPDLPGDMREIFRIVKPGGRLVLIAEIHKGAHQMGAKLVEKYAELAGMTLLTVDGHRELFANTGYSGIEVHAEPRKGWICCTGKKPSRRNDCQ